MVGEQSEIGNRSINPLIVGGLNTRGLQMIDTSLIERIISEGAIGCAEASRLFGTFRSGRPCHPATISRWCISGVRVRDGRRVKLEHFRGAGTLFSTSP